MGSAGGAALGSTETGARESGVGAGGSGFGDRGSGMGAWGSGLRVVDGPAGA